MAEQSPEGPSTSEETTQQLYEQLRQKNAQIAVLQKKLLHFRRWVSSVHAKVQVMNPQAIKNSKKLYVGNIPPDTTEEKNFAFIELRSVEETSNAVCLDGVAFKDGHLKIRRPSNYDIATAIMLGPALPDPTMDTSQLDICRTVVDDSPSKLFVGGLSCEWSEEQVKELLTPFGSLRSFNLVMDKSTGKSKGYAFCEYADESVTDVAIQQLNQRKTGSRALTVKRALEGNQQAAAAAAGSSEQEAVLFGGIGGVMGGGGGGYAQSPGLAGPMTPAGPSGFAGFNVGQAAYPMAGLFPLPMQPTTPPKMYSAGPPGMGPPGMGPPGMGPGIGRRAWAPAWGRARAAPACTARRRWGRPAGRLGRRSSSRRRPCKATGWTRACPGFRKRVRARDACRAGTQRSSSSPPLRP